MGRGIEGAFNDLGKEIEKEVLKPAAKEVLKPAAEGFNKEILKPVGIHDFDEIIKQYLRKAYPNIC